MRLFVMARYIPFKKEKNYLKRKKFHLGKKDYSGLKCYLETIKIVLSLFLVDVLLIITHIKNSLSGLIK
jgi:hypothetical protein